MKQLTTEKGTFMAVEVPSVLLKYEIYNNLLVMDNSYIGICSKKNKIKKGDTKGFIKLPTGNWQILSTELNEEVANTVVYSTYCSTNGCFLFKNYRDNDFDFEFEYTALESLHSLLQSNGIDHNKKIVLLKKI